MLGLECIEDKGKTNLRSCMLRSANIFSCVADHISHSFKFCLQHSFVVGTVGQVICLMPLR